MGTKRTFRTRACRIMRQYKDKWLNKMKVIPLCSYCGFEMHTPEEITADHVIPLSKGGASNRSNIVPCCRDCNVKKGSDVWQPKFPFYKGGAFG